MRTLRDFLKAGTLGGSGLYLASKFGFVQRAFTQAVPGGSIDPYAIPRFVTPLWIPTAMPATKALSGVDYYEVAARQVRQQVLPSGLPATTLWATDRSTTMAPFIHPRRPSRRGMAGSRASSGSTV